MKPSQQSVSAQPVLLFNPRLTAGSPYTPSTRKLGKEYTKDELELMRLELAKDLEKEEATPLSEDPAAVEQRREEELRAFAGSGAEAGEEEHEPELVDFEALEKGLALPPDMETYARSCEKQRDDASVPPALPVRLGRQAEQPREPREPKELELCEQQPQQENEQPKQPKQQQPEQTEQPEQAKQPEQQQQQEDPLSELVPALCDPVASFRLMERLMELEERLKDRPARDKPLPSFMRPTRTAPASNAASNAASPKLPTAKGAKKSPASPPPARFESRFANRHAQTTQTTQTAQHTPAVVPRRNLTPRPAPKPTPKPAPKPAPKPEPKPTYAPPPVRSRLYLPSVYHAATLPAALSATMSAARPGKEITRRSFSPLMRAKTPTEEFAPLEVRTANPRSKLPLPMVLRYPMLQSLSTRNSLAGTVEERREAEVGAWRGREA